MSLSYCPRWRLAVSGGWRSWRGRRLSGCPILLWGTATQQTAAQRPDSPPREHLVIISWTQQKKPNLDKVSLFHRPLQLQESYVVTLRSLNSKYRPSFGMSGVKKYVWGTYRHAPDRRVTMGVVGMPHDEVNSSDLLIGGGNNQVVFPTNSVNLWSWYRDDFWFFQNIIFVQSKLQLLLHRKQMSGPSQDQWGPPRTCVWRHWQFFWWRLCKGTLPRWRPLPHGSWS